MSYHNDDEEDTDTDTGMLLNLSQKSNIFVADQTPTPTRLIKNCEEVGLFEDLRNVNPFDETFRRACEQNVQHTPLSHNNFHTIEESLHTPQVFPQFDAAVEGGICAGEDLTKQTLDTPVVLGISPVESVVVDAPLSTAVAKSKTAERATQSIKYRPIAEKPPAVTQNAGVTIVPSSVQFMQPQLITLAFPTSSAETINCTTSITLRPSPEKTNIKTKPLLLPKLATNSNNSTKDACLVSSTCSTTSSPTTPHLEPSSASLTPTSQLPIKERLKAILNQSSKTRPPEWPDKNSNNNIKFNKINGCKTHSSYCSPKSTKDDTMERRRAASTRYRHKMRNEHRELKKRNLDLQSENERLKLKIRNLEAEVTKLQSNTIKQPVLASSTPSAYGVPAQIQIPASAIHLVMNIPKLVVPCGSSDANTQTILKNPITYRIDKS